MTAQDISSFVQYIESTIFESQEEVSPHVLHQVVQFNIRRKQCLEQLVALLCNERMRLGDVLRRIPHYMGMLDFMVNGHQARECYVSGVHCEKGRHVVLCEKINKIDEHPHSFSFFVRSDIYRFIRFFYFLQHFNFYVTRVIVDSSAIERISHSPESSFIKQLCLRYNHAMSEITNVVLMLET